MRATQNRWRPPLYSTISVFVLYFAVCSTAFSTPSRYIGPDNTPLRHKLNQPRRQRHECPLSSSERRASSKEDESSEEEEYLTTRDNASSTNSIRGGGATALPKAPTLTELCNFALPCLALWIAGPLLSLVDTATVGLSAPPGKGPAQLGALGPATTFIDGATYLFAFLNVATTNLYASALASNKCQTEEEGRKAGDGVARTAAKVSLICGFGIMGVLFRVGKPLLRLYVGADIGDDTIVGPAFDYVRIRALSMPTSLLYGVIQAALLGAKDSVTPLIAIAYSTVVNSLGDLLCVCKLGMALRGAGLATLLAQWAGTAAMIGPAKKRLFEPRLKGKVNDPKEVVTVDENGNKSNGKYSVRAFLSFAAPVLTLILGKLAAFGFMTHVAASLPDKSALAAHQITLSLFFFVSPFLEVISQTAQAFLPQYYTEKVKDEPSWIRASEDLSARLLRLGIGVAIIMAIVSSSIPYFFPNALTNDATVRAAVRPLALPLALGALLTAPVAVSEGALLAKRDLKFLAGVYLLSTAMFPSVLFRVKKMQGPVEHVWTCFAGFQLFRAVCFTGRLWTSVLWRRFFGKDKMEGGATASAAA
mmetsp:Transcript_46975/g.69562  ORF Transcript_46975/g.69562 Transcript_46975/m.69562 type:complete len:590 (-) Transcript_46975:171-1940(-)